MALLDRLSTDISVHRFCSAMELFSSGDFTKAQVVNGLGLTPDDEIQLDKLITFYNGLTTQKKQVFKNKLESVLILFESGDLTQNQVINLLGLN